MIGQDPRRHRAAATGCRQRARDRPSPFRLALDLLSYSQACYRQADDDLKRAFSRLLFDKLYVDENGVIGDRLKLGFRKLVQAVRPEPDSAHHDRSPAQGPGGASRLASGSGPRTWPLAGPGSSNPSLVDVILRYSNRTDLVGMVEDLLIRLDNLPDAPPEPSSSPPARSTAQTHGLREDQVQAIFRCYRDGVGPRALAGQYGVTERAIKYLLKKHGVQRTRRGGELLGGRP